MIEVVNSIINQKGTPAFYSDVYAKRPNYGYPGRVFISTDTYQIFQDTGTSWILISDAGSGSSNLEQVTTNGNTTDKGIVITANGINATGINEMLYTNAAYAGNTNFGLYANVNTTFQTTAPTGGNSLASVIGTASYTFSSSLAISNSTPIDGIAATPSFTIASGQTLSFTQKGNSFRGLAGLRSTIYANNSQGTLSHAAGLLINGYYDPSNAGTLTNYFGLVVNDSNEYGFGTVTNRYGIAQVGTGDINYFLGKMLLGSSVDQGVYELQVTGATLLTGSLSGTSATFNSNLDLGTNTGFKLFYYGNGGNTGYINGIGLNLTSSTNVINNVIGGSTSANSGTATWAVTRGNGTYPYTSYTDLFTVDSRTGNVNITTGALSGTSATFSSLLTAAQYSTDIISKSSIASGYSVDIADIGPYSANTSAIVTVVGSNGNNSVTSKTYLLNFMGSGQVGAGVKGLTLLSRQDFNGGAADFDLYVASDTPTPGQNQLSLYQNNGFPTNFTIYITVVGGTRALTLLSTPSYFGKPTNGIISDSYLLTSGGTLTGPLYGTTASFSGNLSIGNTVTPSLINTVTNKIQIVVGGTTYYLLASTSNA